MSTRSRNRLGWAVFVTFALALIMGTGPGILLVNSAEPVLVGGVELPRLYAWGLVWYAVEVGCVIVACVLLWTREDADT